MREMECEKQYKKKNKALLYSAARRRGTHRCIHWIRVGVEKLAPLVYNAVPVQLLRHADGLKLLRHVAEAHALEQADQFPVEALIGKHFIN